jgi:hypothetical protein
MTLRNCKVISLKKTKDSTVTGSNISTLDSTETTLGVGSMYLLESNKNGHSVCNLYLLI